MTSIDHAGPDFGANSWLVDEMYAQYLADAEAVSESWREFFSDYRGGVPTTFGAHQNGSAGANGTPTANGQATTAPTVVAPAPAPTPSATPAAPAAPVAKKNE